MILSIFHAIAIPLLNHNEAGNCRSCRYYIPMLQPCRNAAHHTVYLPISFNARLISRCNAVPIHNITTTALLSCTAHFSPTLPLFLPLSPHQKDPTQQTYHVQHPLYPPLPFPPLHSHPIPGHHLCPNQAMKQRPRQDEATEALQQARSPELGAASKEHLHAAAAPVLHKVRRRHRSHAEDVYERAGKQREEHVKHEARVRLQAQDAGARAEERGC
jgi:hypothetical protein